MANFVWAAKDRDGKSIVRNVEAETVEESKALLLAEGCTDLRLTGDRVADIVAQSFPRVANPEAELDEMEEQMARVFGRPVSHLLRRVYVVLETLEFVFGLLFLIVILVLVNWRFGSGFVALGVALLVSLVLWLRLPLTYYNRVVKAKEWHRWEEVRKMVPRLETISRYNFVRVPAVEIARTRAQALAGIGMLPEALAEMQRNNEQQPLPSWWHKLLLADIYDIAGDHDTALQYALEAAKEEKTAVVQLDLAQRLLHRYRDAGRGRTALAEAEKETIVEVAEPAHKWCRGMLRYLERDYASARSELEESLGLIRKMKHMSYRDAQTSTTRAYLCCVLAQQGDIEAARREFALAQPFLIATDEKRLLEDCRRAIGVL